MARGAPDWTKKIEVTVNPGQAKDEYAAGAAGSYVGTDAAYQTVASWTVTADRTGELKEILIISTNYGKTLAKVTIDSVVWATDWAPQSCLPLIFEDLRLAAAAVVKVEVKSSDGSSITVDAIIVAKEVLV